MQLKVKVIKGQEETVQVSKRQFNARLVGKACSALGGKRSCDRVRCQEDSGK